MRLISANERQRIEYTQESSFFDTCQIGTFSYSVDSYGDIVKSWNYGVDTACGVEFLDGYERINGQVEYTGVIVKVRLPYDTALTTDDRIKVNGVAYDIRSISGRHCKVVRCEYIKV